MRVREGAGEPGDDGVGGEVEAKMAREEGLPGGSSTPDAGAAADGEGGLLGDVRGDGEGMVER